MYMCIFSICHTIRYSWRQARYELCLNHEQYLQHLSHPYPIALLAPEI